MLVTSPMQSRHNDEGLSDLDEGGDIQMVSRGGGNKATGKTTHSIVFNSRMIPLQTMEDSLL